MEEAVAPSLATIKVLRAIAQAEFAHGPVKALCNDAGWEPIIDEPAHGHIRYAMLLNGGCAEFRPLTVLTAEHNPLRRAFVPLYYFDDYDARREPFDQAFAHCRTKLTGLLGKPSRPGTYGYPHRANWLYSYCAWTLPDATFVLTQDEFDIQFGMDVSLWVLPAGVGVETPMRCE
jgi:hypothetical protein